MAKQLWFLNTAATTHRGNNDTNLVGSATWWTPYALAEARGAAAATLTAATVAGPTAGIEVRDNGPVTTKAEWLSEPLSADFTVAGTITGNLWGFESAMTDNSAINLVVDKLDGASGALTQIAKSAFTTELALTSAVNSFTVTPTSTAVKRGDRLRVRVFFDDVGTMAAGTSTFRCGGPTASADADSWIQFTETLTFEAAGDPSGSKYYLTDTAETINPGSAVEKKALTTRGSSTVTAVTNTAAGPTAGIQATGSAGGTAIEWYTPPLDATTLGGKAKINVWAIESSTSANASLRGEIAICATDGTGATVWGSACVEPLTTAGELPGSDAAAAIWVAGDDTSITASQRLRFRIYVEDIVTGPLVTGFTVSVKYNGATAGALADTYVILPQTVTEAFTGTTKALAGTLTTAGAMGRSTGKSLAGTLTSAGLAAKRMSRGMAGTLTSSATLVKRAQKALAGSLASAGGIIRVTFGAAAAFKARVSTVRGGDLVRYGSVAGATVVQRSFAGTLTTAGALANTPQKALAAALTSSATLVRSTFKLLSASLTTAGSLTRRWSVFLSMTGTLTTAGALAKEARKILGGSLRFDVPVVLDANLGTASQNNVATTIALTTSAAVAAGARIFVLVQYRNTTALIASAADNGPGLTWEILNDTAINSPTRLAWLSAYAPAGMVSGRTITVTLSSAPAAIGNICAVSFTGVASVSPTDVTTTGTPAGANWTTSITTVTDGDLVLGGFTVINATTMSNVATGGVEVHDFYGGANGRYVTTAYLAAGAAGSYTLSGTLTGLSGASLPLTSLLGLKGVVAGVGTLTRLKVVAKAFAGTLTTGATLVRSTSKFLAGSLTTSASLLRSTSRLFAASLASAGALTRLTKRFLAGTVTSGATLVRSTQKLLAGALTSAGSLTRRWSVFLAMAGTLTSSGALAKQAQKKLTGALTSSAALGAQKVIARAFAGTLTSSATMVRSTSKLVGGTLATSATLVRSTSRLLAGTLTSGGALVRQTQKKLVATLASAGALATTRLGGVTSLSFAGTLATSATLVRSTQKALAASLTSAGSLTRRWSVFISMTGTLTTGGVLVKQAQKRLTGTLSSAGAFAQQTQKRLTGTLASVGSLAAIRLGGLTSLSFAGTLTTSATLVRSTSKFLAATLTSSGTLTRLFQGRLFIGGTLATAGALAKEARKKLGGNLQFDMPVAFDANLGTASQNNTATTIALTTTSAVAVGARIFVLVQYRNTTGIVASAADNGPGLTWEILNDAVINGSTRLAWLSAYAPAGMVSGRTITVTLSTAPTSIGNICAVSFTGVASVSPTDATATATPAGANWTSSITTVTAGDLVLGGFTVITTTTTSNVATSGTEIHDFWGSAAQRYVTTAYLIAGAPGSYTLSGTLTGLTSPSQPLTSLLGLKVALAGGGTLARLKLVAVALAGTLTTSATLVRSTQKKLAGAFAGAGAAVMQHLGGLTQISFGGTLTSAATLVRLTKKPFAGTLSAGQYFGTDASESVTSKAVTGSSIYPRDAAACAAAIKRHSWEPRADNATANATVGDGSYPWGADALNTYWAGFYARVLQVGGQFTGTTTECISWAAARWGIDEDVIRAVCVQESDWHMSATGDVCGPVGEASYGITQIKNKYCGGADAWGGYPDTTQSTALNLDFYGCYIRTAFDGYFKDAGTYLYGGGTVGSVAAAHDWDYVLWGCVGSWFSGDWYDTAAVGYINSVKAHLAAREWETYSPPTYFSPLAPGTAGKLVRQTQKRLAATLASAGALATSFITGVISRSFAGTLATSAALTRQTQKRLAATFSPTGAMSTFKGAVLTLAGTLTTAGALTRQTQKRLAATMGSTAQLVRSTQKILAATLTPTGAMSTFKGATLALAGTLATAGALTRQTQKRLAATLAPAGQVAKQISTRMLATLTSSGTMTRFKGATVALAGTLATSATLVRRTTKGLPATLAPTGALAKTMTRQMAGTLTTAGALARQTLHTLFVGGTLATAGALRRTIRKSVAGILATNGLLSRGFTGATVFPSGGPGSIVRAVGRLLDTRAGGRIDKQRRGRTK